MVASGRASVRLETINREAVTLLGMAGNPNTQSQWLSTAFDAGINIFFFYNLSFSGMIAGLRPLLKRERERVIVATGTESRDPFEMRRQLDRIKAQLQVSVIDLFFAEYISPSDGTDDVMGVGGALDEIWRWREEGAVRYVGATVHARSLALKLIASRKVEVLMHRYNMAHRGAVAEVLPAAMDAGIPVVAFTCTRWGSLLKGHPEWAGEIPTAVDCYRYALCHPAIDVALTAPASLDELQGNLEVMKEPMAVDAGQITSWESYGDLVYGSGADAFETKWP